MRILRHHRQEGYAGKKNTASRLKDKHRKLLKKKLKHVYSLDKQDRVEIEHNKGVSKLARLNGLLARAKKYGNKSKVSLFQKNIDHLKNSLKTAHTQ